MAHRLYGLAVLWPGLPFCIAAFGGTHTLCGKVHLALTTMPLKGTRCAVCAAMVPLPEVD